MNVITPSMMESLIAAAGMTAFAEDCDRILMFKRPVAPPIEAPLLPDAEFLPAACPE